MEKLFNKLFKDEDPKAFRGTGHRLGTSAKAPRATTSSSRDPTTVPNSSSKQAKPSSVGASGHQRTAVGHPAHPPGVSQFHNSGGMPRAGPSGGMSPAAATLAQQGPILSSTPTAKELHGMAGANTMFASMSTPHSVGGAGGTHLETVGPAGEHLNPATISDPTRKEKRVSLSSAGSMNAGEVSTFEMHSALAMVLSHPAHADTLTTLSRILRNILMHSTEPKYRTIRLGNKKVQEEVVTVPGAIEFLQACGFQFQADGGGGGGGGDQGCAQMPESTPIGRIEAGWQELCAVMAANGVPHPTPKQPVAPEAASPAPAPAAPLVAAAPAMVAPIDRGTQVILPVSPDVEVPDWFFERTGADLKAEYSRMVHKREAAEQFTTRAMRERQAMAKQGRRPTTATVRVRFPEGVCLQGTFGVREPLSALHVWVTERLRSPAITYDLVEPGRSVLPASGTVNDAGLAPSSVLNFRPTAGAASMFRGVPMLSDAALQQTQARY